MSYNTPLGTNQKLVVDEAVRQLENKKWFKGVCLDNLPSEDYCAKHFDDVVGSLTFETAMWDNPDFYKG